MSEQPTSHTKTSHRLRLALRMIVGTFAGFGVGVATHAVGNGFDPWFRSAPFVYAIAGAMIGLFVELLTPRDEPTKRALVLAVLIFGLIAIFGALIR